jgi:immediate early response 3-interacting protein 1
MFGLFQLLVSGVLLVNAMAVLHEERFLRPMGYGASDGFPGQSALKDKIVPVLSAMRVLRTPLILVNVLAILYLIVLG